jgi:hypothetical protein
VELRFRFRNRNPYLLSHCEVVSTAVHLIEKGKIASLPAGRGSLAMTISKSGYRLNDFLEFSLEIRYGEEVEKEAGSECLRKRSLKF